MMKKMLALLMAMLMTLSLVACGSNGDKDNNKTGTDGVTEVLMWSAFSAPIDAELMASAEAFNASQDKYKVNVQYQGQFTEIYTKLTTTLNQKDLPSLAVVSTELAGTYGMTEGLIRPISQYCTAEDEMWTS